MSDDVLLGERFPAKVAATFASRDRAMDVSAELREAGFGQQQIRLVAPDDAQAARKIEPESAGIARTLARSHVRLGGTGLAVGLAAAALGIRLDVPLIAASPLFSFMVLAFFGTIAGLLLAGLISMRPDHDPMAMKTLAAAKRGQWTLVVHAADSDEQREARRLLEERRGEPVATL